jgi:hypothetical protein
MSTDPPPPSKAKRRWRVTLPGLALVGAMAALALWLGGADLRGAWRDGSIDRRGIGSGRLRFSESPILFIMRVAVVLVIVVGLPILFATMLLIYFRQRGERIHRD